MNSHLVSDPEHGAVAGAEDHLLEGISTSRQAWFILRQRLVALLYDGPLSLTSRQTLAQDLKHYGTLVEKEIDMENYLQDTQAYFDDPSYYAVVSLQNGDFAAAANAFTSMWTMRTFSRYAEDHGQYMYFLQYALDTVPDLVREKQQELTEIFQHVSLLAHTTEQHHDIIRLLSQWYKL